MKACSEPVQYGKGHNFGAYHHRCRHMDKLALKINYVSAIFSLARITTCRDGKFMVTLGGRTGGYPAKSTMRSAMPRQLISVLQFIEEAKEENLDLSQVFLDRDDLAEISEESAEEE